MTKQRFILELPLKTEVYQVHLIQKMFRLGYFIYKDLVLKAKEILRKLEKDIRYQEIKYALKHSKNKKPLYKERKDMIEEYGFSKSNFEKMVKVNQKMYSRHINSHVAQKIALQVWDAFDEYFFGKGRFVNLKPFHLFSSLEGKNNTTGIRFDKETKSILIGKNLILPVIYDEWNSYEVEAMYEEVCYSRIVRKVIRGKERFFIQLVLKGTPPSKRNRHTGIFTRTYGSGEVGLDIGTSTVAVSSKESVSLNELAPDINALEKEEAFLQRKLDRSRKSMNPEYFNSNGTIKRISKKEKREWKNSKTYDRTRNKLAEIRRIKTEKRKQSHEQLANYIISQGDIIYVEEMSFKGLQKRGRKKDGTTRRRFGKSLLNKAPAMLLSIIDRKLSYQGKTLLKVDTFSFKASQFNHIDKTYQKKSLSTRWQKLLIGGEEVLVQRDLYSAFLLMNSHEDLKSSNVYKCSISFGSFLEKHNLFIQDLKNSSKKFVKSIGI